MSSAGASHGAATAFATERPAAKVGTSRTVNLVLATNDVIPTGNDWIALPSIRTSDAALQNFNVISMRYRGLLEVACTLARRFSRDGAATKSCGLPSGLLEFW